MTVVAPQAWLGDLPQPIRWIATIILICLLPVILVYLAIYLQENSRLKDKQNGARPPQMPYTLPILGNLLPYLSNPSNFISRARAHFGDQIPVQIRLLNQTMYLIPGPENVKAIFRESRSLSTRQLGILTLGTVFGSSAKGMDVYERDDTGIQTQALEGSKSLEARNRIFHAIHKGFNSGLNGPGLAELGSQFAVNFQREIEDLVSRREGGDWVHVPDLYEMIKNTVFRASTEAMCGPHLLALNPEFVDDFWKFDTLVGSLFKQLPKWMVPNVFKARDKLRDAVMRWHEFARTRFEWEDRDQDQKQWEEYFGLKLMRERQRMFEVVDGMDDQSKAASDFGILWGANANIVPLIGWCILDIIQRPNLHTRVVAELSDHTGSPLAITGSSKMQANLANPLLQSIFSEELRLRSSTLIPRSPLGSNFTLGPWGFPKDALLLISSWHEGRNRNVWSEGGTGDFHSIEDFWEDRFLQYPENSESGSANRRSATDLSEFTPLLTQEVVPSARGMPKFSTERVVGSFVPFGGGQNLCPGRNYAKQEAISAIAILLGNFELELLDGKGVSPEPDMKYFSIGVVPPKGKFAARIRKRP